MLWFIIDGYNVIKQHKKLKHINLSEARQKLKAITLRQIAANKATLVYDGSSLHFTNPVREKSLVEEVFSRGESADDYIKRIIRIPGDKIEIANGEIYLNDKKLEEPYVKNRSYENMPPTIVPDDSFFVLGDNRPNSSDSRYWGFVPRKNVVGRAWIVFWPLNRIRLP